MLTDPDFRAKLAAVGGEPPDGSVTNAETRIPAAMPRTEALIKPAGMALQ